MSNMIVFLLAAAGIVSIGWQARSYFSQVRSNAFSDLDYWAAVLYFTLGAVIIAGPLMQLPGLASVGAVLYLLAALAIAAFVGPLVLRQLKSYMRPGSWDYGPRLIRYWPSWVLVKDPLVLNETTEVAFRLVPSVFDVNLVLVSESSPDSPQKKSGATAIRMKDLLDREGENLVLSRDLSYPHQAHSERAITQTGYFLSETAVKLACEAPAFEPSHQEVNTDIETLSRSPVHFALMPKASGRQILVFKILTPNNVLKGSMQVECTVAKSRSRIVAVAFKIGVVLTYLAGLISSLALGIEKLIHLVRK